MVGAVSKQRLRHFRRHGQIKRTHADGPLCYGVRRRRWPRPSITLLAVVGLLTLAVAGVVAAATNNPLNKHVPAPRAPAASVRLRARVRLSDSVRRRSQESLAINAVLRYTPFISAGTSRHRVIALTFDDGPSPYTRQIVQILTRMRVPATFFIVGQQLNDFSSALGDEISHQFEIGDHTENHAFLTRLNPANQYGQINDVALKVRHLGAPFPRLFRPPYGMYNAHTLTVLRRLRMLMVLWSVDPGDWRRPGTAAIVANVLANARPGAIVIMHDGGGDRSQTVAALPAIINGLRRRHYELVTVPRMIVLDPPPRHQRLPHIGAA
jgi:peptidoglycan/xylan/chitin deacetylase (PgdA/CDA1 family)